MANALKMKLNLPANRCGIVFRAPNALKRMFYNGRKLTSSAHALASAVFTFSNVKDKNDAEYRATYAQMSAEMGLSRNSIAAGMEALDALDVVSSRKVATQGNAYTYVGAQTRGFDAIPMYLYTLEVNVDGELRRLTKAQVRVLAFLIAAGEAGMRRKCECSVSEIVYKLKLSKTTVASALRFFIKAGLVSCPSEDRGNSCKKRSVYHIDIQLYAYRKYRKWAKMSDKARENAEIEAKKDFYAAKQAENEERANKYAKWVLSIPRMSEISQEIKMLSTLEMAKAELGQSKYTVAEVQHKLLKARTAREMLLRSNNVVRAKMDARSYASCSCCGDTGQRKDGTSCDCWQVMLWT